MSQFPSNLTPLYHLWLKKMHPKGMSELMHQDESHYTSAYSYFFYKLFPAEIILF